jgi:uncharacterized repeat protein (TIGR01451 family)
MRSRVRLVGYLLVGVILLGLLIVGSHVWAVPEQTGVGQTVPTLTPGRSHPTEPKAADTPPPPTEVVPSVPPPTQTPAVPPSPTSTSSPAAGLVLVKEVASEQVWPGTTVHYTLTLSNSGAASARQVVVSDILPEGLEPGQILIGKEAVWDGRTMRAEVLVLPPGSHLVMAFTAVVQADVTSGAVLTNQAIASAAGNLRATSAISVVLPPVELPPTGGSP